MHYIKTNPAGSFTVIEKRDIVLDANVLEIAIPKSYGYSIKLEFIDYRSAGHNARFKRRKSLELCNVCHFISGEVFHIG